MNPRSWQWIAMATGILVGSVQAAEPAANSDAIIVLREPGKSDRKCIIERTTPQLDGTFLHEVRDTVTGERMRVVDSRHHKGLLGQGSGSAASALGPGSGSTASVACKPRLATTAELACYMSPPSPQTESATRIGGILRRTKPATTTFSPVQVEIRRLKEALGPTDREAAAMTLTLSDARTTPEVIEALVTAAKIDPTPSVRVCLVRCLYRLSDENAQLVPVIQAMQDDPNEEVKRTAQLAMQELGKK
jgi:hypothetical protein